MDPVTIATIVVAGIVDNSTKLDVNITQVLERQEVRPAGLVCLLLRGPGLKFAASSYTRKRLSLSQEPGRKPGASYYTRKRLSLSLSLALVCVSLL